MNPELRGMSDVLTHFLYYRTTGYMQQDSSDKSRCSSRIGYLYYYSSPVGKNMSPKFDVFLALRSQFDSDHRVDFLCAYWKAYMLPIRDLWTVSASAGYGVAPRSKKYVSKYFNGFFITINSTYDPIFQTHHTH